MKVDVDHDDIIEKQVSSDGRIYLGKEYAGKSYVLAIIEEVKDSEED
jgi:hypothetical protein